MSGWLRPSTVIDNSALLRGLRWNLLDAVTSQVMGTLVGGAFLVAFAIRLGASNTAIGVIAAAGPLAQILQMPAVTLVDRFRRRKAIVVVASLFARLFWFGAAAVPFLPATSPRLTIFFFLLFAYYGLTAISGCAFSSWMRDFIPEDRIGRLNARRTAASVTAGAAVGLAAGFAVDHLITLSGEPELVFAGLFALGGSIGLFGVFCLTRIPEPRMPTSVRQGFVEALLVPFKDERFAPLLKFLASWNLAASFAAPFFTVYLLVDLEQSLAMVLTLTVLSQIVHVVVVPIWGRLADSYGNRSVLSVAGPLYTLSLLMWPFTTMPDPHPLTVPLLVVIHVLAGLSTAGVRLASSGIALKLAPRGAATAYLGVNAFVCGLASTVAPIVAGVCADWFAERELGLDLRWSAPGAEVDLSAISISGFDFLFLLSALGGFYAIHRQLAVVEEGEIESEEVRHELVAEVRRTLRHVSSVAGMLDFALFPFALVRDLVKGPGSDDK